MISANIPTSTRRAVYRRDGYRCALCDSTKYLQIHHYCPRSCGGNDTPENLITLCSDCHALAHGIALRDYGREITPEEIAEGCGDYLVDFYGPDWWPYK